MSLPPKNVATVAVVVGGGRRIRSRRADVPAAHDRAVPVHHGQFSGSLRRFSSGRERRREGISRRARSRLLTRMRCFQTSGTARRTQVDDHEARAWSWRPRPPGRRGSGTRAPTRPGAPRADRRSEPFVEPQPRPATGEPTERSTRRWAGVGRAQRGSPRPWKAPSSVRGTSVSVSPAARSHSVRALPALGSRRARPGAEDSLVRASRRVDRRVLGEQREDVGARQTTSSAVRGARPPGTVPCGGGTGTAGSSGAQPKTRKKSAGFRVSLPGAGAHPDGIRRRKS